MADLDQFKGLKTVEIISKLREQKATPVESIPSPVTNISKVAKSTPVAKQATKSNTKVSKVSEPSNKSSVAAEVSSLTATEDTSDQEIGSESMNIDSQEASTEMESVESDESLSEVAEDASPAVNTREKVSVFDDSGRREIEVDFADRETLKKYVQMAHGARKWQADRDKTVEKLSQSQERLRKVEDNLKALDDAFQREGVEGVIDLLHGERGASKKWIESKVERADFLKYANPDQVRALETQEQFEKLQREMKLEQQRNQEYKKTIDAEREEATQRSLEAIIEPSFMKYGFTGKLGNSEDEDLFNKMLYRTVMDNLQSKDGENINSADIEGEFKKISESLSRRITAQAEKKASKIVDDKKKVATQAVQKTVKSNQSKDSAMEQEVGELLKNRDYTKLFSGIRKYNSFLGR